MRGWCLRRRKGRLHTFTRVVLILPFAMSPALIGVTTWVTESARLGMIPLIGLFVLGLILIIWVHPEGEDKS
jgi:MFS-type transporter involved in bile tolerance (Atg22 family)